MNEPAPLRKCCAAFDKAQVTGTDNEGWSYLIYQDWSHPGPVFIGSKLPPIAFCPWCAAPIAETKTEETP